jgi:hypothetical protein
LRERAAATGTPAGRLKVRNLTGNVRALHQVPEFAGGLFQVASQFNLLEMMPPGITPEHGVTLYQHDGTQGPACAMAAGAAIIYRNYFVPLDGGMGQTSQRQINALAGLGQALNPPAPAAPGPARCAAGRSARAAAPRRRGSPPP